MNKSTSLTRTCSSCGIEKPLTSFLQIIKGKGTVYGSLCSNCRSNKGNNPIISISDEDNTTIGSGKKIDSKERVFTEQEKRKKIKNLKELYIKESKIKDNEANKKIEHKANKKQSEKDHRKFYLETSKNILNKNEKDSKDTTEEDFKKDTDKKNEKSNNKKSSDEKEFRKQEEIIKQELKITSLDFSSPFMSIQANPARFQSDVFLQFKSWLGAGSPLARTLDQMYKKTNPTQKASRGSFLNNNDIIKNYIEEASHKPSPTKKR
ncbi:hypothetical protein N9L02_00030 [Gammaproteobacteria bacterium]|nr:hypothetical protein [Gammaproteobacteria bacterium]